MLKPLIVVGVDGSSSSSDALRWAADYARLVNGRLFRSYAWSPPVVATIGVPPLEIDWTLLREQAKRFPGEIVHEVLGDEQPDLAVASVATTGSPAQVLVDESEHAALLVVGSRGLGGLKGMVLGSVGHHCAAHAYCPVVIVHQPRAEKRRKVRRDPLQATATT
jgi:Universal stress protein UspA and related nucleotide-binding proteins